MRTPLQIPRLAKCSLILTAALGLSAVERVNAETDYWRGNPGVTASTNWSDAANWTGNGVYYNEVIFAGAGTGAPYVINNVLDSATSQASYQPMWALRIVNTNGCYTTLIPDGITMTVAAGYGSTIVGAGRQSSYNVDVLNAAETNSITGAGGALTVAGNLTVGQGSAVPDLHNIVFDLSGLGTFNHTGNRFLIANSGAQREQGTIFLARSNYISLGSDFQIGYVGNYSNSMPCAAYLGITNTILVGSGSPQVVVGYTGCTNGTLKFNPSFIGGGNPTPTAYFGSTAGGGRANNFWIGINTGGQVGGYGICDFTGGLVTVMANNLELGRAGSSVSSARGVLTLDNGTIDANTVIVGNQTGDAAGAGVINLGANATLTANTSLTLGAATGAATSGSGGTINVNGGKLIANLITNGVGTTAALYMANGTLQFPAVAPGNTSTPQATLTSLSTGGTTNLIIVNFASNPASYPFTNALVKYTGTIGGAGFNFGAALPTSLWQGYLRNNTAASQIELIVTAGPSTLLWSGVNPGGIWDVGTTIDWLFGTTPATFNQFDFVRFDDTASGTTTVNLTGTLTPTTLTVSNNIKTYSFTGSGLLAGAIAGGLAKEGTGRLILSSTGGDTFTGGVAIRSGVVQVGNGVDFGVGSLGPASGAVANNGALVFSRPTGDMLAVTNPISGTGALTNLGGTLQLWGANAFSGPVYVSAGSTIQLGSVSALGTTAGATIVASGATLDLNSYGSGAEPIMVRGSGTDGNGALVNNGGGYPMASAVTLTGDATLGGSSRLDIGGFLSTSNNPYNVTLAYSTYCEWRNLSVDPALMNISLISGNMGWVGSTTAGNSSGTLSLAGGAKLTFWADAQDPAVNKNLVLADGSTVQNAWGAATISGSISLNGYDTFDVGYNQLTLSGTLSGTGTLYKSGGTYPLILSGSSPAFAGSASIYSGSVIINGLVGGSVTSQYGTVVAGSGTNTGSVDISGGLVPGLSGTPGTLTVGPLTLQPGATITNDLSALTTGANDLVRVNGNLTANGNTIYLNLIGGTLEGGRPYTLMTYTGSLIGSFGGVATASTTPYTLVLTNVTTTNPKQIQVIVTGGSPSVLAWNNASGTGEWDVQMSPNWTNLTSHVSPDVFYSADAVTFDDRILASPFPTTAIDIAAGQVVSPSVITNNSTTNYTISGQGAISGGARIVKQGTSTLTLATVNDFTGPVDVLGGKLTLGANSALGSETARLTVTNSATVDMNGFSVRSKPSVISGSGAGALGALVNNGSGAIYGDGNGVTALTLGADATVGGTTRWDLGGPSGATLSTGGKSYSLTLAGNPGTYYEWNSVHPDTNFANLNILGGELGVKGTTTMGNPTNTVTIFGGAQMTFWGGSGYAKNYYVKSNAQLVVRYDGPVFDMNVTLEGGATFVTINAVKTFTQPITLLGLAHFLTGDSLTTFNNVIGGPGGFYWDAWNNQLAFAAINTYTGPTLIGSGLTLALVGNGSIANSALIYFGGSATNDVRLDVSGRSDQTLTLGSAQSLMGIGRVNGRLVEPPGATIAPGTNGTLGVITADNTVTLNGTTLMKLTGAGADLIQTGGSINYGGTLSLSFTPGTLTAGNSFKLFSATNYAGSFQLTPATPGTGLAWDTSTLAVNGTLKVVSATVSRPSISTIAIGPAGVVLSGASGTPGGTYYVLTSTNVALPVINWTALATNQFDGSGNFNWTNAIDPGTAKRFYLLQVQ